jgi:hypothetical protein
MIETRTFENGGVVVFEKGPYQLPPEHIQIALAVEAACMKIVQGDGESFSLKGLEGVEIIVRKKC